MGCEACCQEKTIGFRVGKLQVGSMQMNNYFVLLVISIIFHVNNNYVTFYNLEGRKLYAEGTHCCLRYIHPIDDKECPVVIGGDYITTETGTGLVHTAPGHGQEDYVTGQKYGLPIFSPVDDDGKFTEEAGQFSGLDVLGEGNTAVVKYLDEHLSLIMEESYGKFLLSLIIRILQIIIDYIIIIPLLF